VLNLAALSTGLASTSIAQQQNAVVPTFVNFTGTLTDANSKPFSGAVDVTRHAGPVGAGAEVAAFVNCCTIAINEMVRRRVGF